MYCKLIEPEINDCIHRYLEENFNLPADKEIQISYTSSRGSDGLTAEINIPVVRKSKIKPLPQAEKINNESDPPFEPIEKKMEKRDEEKLQGIIPEEKPRQTLFSRMTAPQN